MKSYEIVLKKLKTEINALLGDEEKRFELIKEYNNNLYEILPVLNKPLPKECELHASLILNEYKEFKDDFKIKGYFTFKKYIDLINIIAEIRVKRVKKGGTIVHAEVNKLYKGEIPPTLTIEVLMSWKPDRWFSKGEECLVFLSCEKPGKYLASSLKSRMPITIENNDTYITSFNCEPEFWGDAQTISVLTTQWDYLTKVRYADVVRQIKEMH